MLKSLYRPSSTGTVTSYRAGRPANGRISDEPGRNSDDAWSIRAELLDAVVGHDLAARVRMSLPRRIVPGKTWMLTRRCTQRQFLLRPDDEVNNAFLYCLLEAAQKFGVSVLLAQMLANHVHVVLHDPEGNVVELVHRFHTHLAKCINAYRGRWENMWSSEPPCLVELVALDDVVDKLVYVATNPVEDGLVDAVHHWPGPATTRALLDGRPVRARRPWFLFRDDGPMPEEVSGTFTIPAELGPQAQIVEVVRERIAAVEDRCARARAATGRPVLGRRQILRQSWCAAPTTHEPRRNLRPRVAARSRWARLEALQRNRDFLLDYRRARARWLAGLTAEFPVGTYWLHRFANVRIARPEPTTAGPPS